MFTGSPFSVVDKGNIEDPKSLKRAACPSVGRTQNPEPGTRNPEPGTQNPEPRTQNPKEVGR
jgi:hypothetical protein